VQVSVEYAEERHDRFHDDAGCRAGTGRVQKTSEDGPQALTPEGLPYFLEDVRIAREAYEQRAALAERFAATGDTTRAAGAGTGN